MSTIISSATSTQFTACKVFNCWESPSSTIEHHRTHNNLVADRLTLWTIISTLEAHNVSVNNHLIIRARYSS